MINVLYFASVKERIGRAGEEVSYRQEINTERLLDSLIEKGEPWSVVLDKESLLVAVNQEMAGWDVEIKDGDEVAFFPPVTGG
ncbi:molybdopterin converting factor subunit 1 [Gammaproteobacteria bacterium 45_16_T64]|nr:molybdopterin converting factor subunit 1 [Gammaproteobacteria bacterium 45_16_T64]